MTPTNSDAAGGSPNRELLDEINRSDAWFRAKKVGTIWARPIKLEQEIRTLEGVETVQPGDYLCRGIAGEIWPQTADSLRRKYNPTDEVDEDGWRKYAVKPDTEGVMAARVDRPFRVRASWGVLTGKPGDFVLKNYADRDIQFPDDVWIVDQVLFKATYRVSEGKK